MQSQNTNTSTLVSQSQDLTSLEREERTLKALKSSIAKRLMMISEYVNSKKNVSQNDLKTSPFLVSKDSNSPLSAQIPQYLNQVVSIGQFDKETLIFAFILLERFIGKSKLRGQINFFKLVAVATYIAFKVLHETEVWFLTDFEDISNFSPWEMRELEIAFLQAVDFKIHVSSKEYRFFKKTLLKKEKANSQ